MINVYSTVIEVLKDRHSSYGENKCPNVSISRRTRFIGTREHIPDDDSRKKINKQVLYNGTTRYVANLRDGVYGSLRKRADSEWFAIRGGVHIC